MSEAKYRGVGSNSDSEDDDFDGRRIGHRCTDVPCCFLFIAAVVAAVVLGSNAAQRGGIGKLYHGIQTDGSICGIDATVQQKPYLSWCFGPGRDGKLSTSSFSIASAQCVARCPNTAAGVAPAACPKGSYSPKNTTGFLGRYCIPEVAYEEGLAQIKSVQFDAISERVTLSLSSIGAAWPLLVSVFFLAFVLGFLYLGLLRCCAEALVWTAIVASALGFGAAGFYLWVTAGTLSDQLPADVRLSQDMLEHEETAARVVAAICWTLTAVVVCLACCLGSSIQRAVSCVEAACDAIFEMPTLLLAPACKAMTQGALAIVLLHGFMSVYSDGHVSAGGKGGIGRHIEHSDEQCWAMVGYMFVAFWVVAFASALYQFTMAFAFVKYYYTPYDMNKEKHVNGFFAGIEGVFVGFMYHSGSLAFGSLLVALLHTLQKLVEYAQSKNHETIDSKLVECVLCCVHCCLGCCEEAVEFVNKNAYIDMAVTSNDFCAAAKEAFRIIVEEAGSMSILNGATYVFTVFGTLVITSICGLVLFIGAGHGPFAVEGSVYQVADPVTVALLGMVLAFCVSLSFMHVFDMAADTLLYCYAYDMGKHSVSNTAPHAFENLMHTHEHDDDGH